MDRIREVSKMAKNASETKKGKKQQQTIARILEEMKGTKNIANIKTAKRRIFIPKINNANGEVVTSRKGTANVFGEFCKKLCDDDDEKSVNEQRR